jgi:bifunctional non-homologous end joining protein LigD
MTRYPLMLPSPSSDTPQSLIRRLQAAGGWTFEFKMDGIRALIVIEGGAITILNRNARNITHRYPDVAGPLHALKADVVLDGEIVCVDTAGRPDFVTVHRRDAQSHTQLINALSALLPAQLVAFDVLVHRGVDLRLLPYLRRREVLASMFPALQDALVVLPPTNTDGMSMWDAVGALEMEGLVAKRNDSRYVGGRSTAWVKIKNTARVSALVTGYDPGKGSRAATFGALHLALVDDEALIPIGSVGSGFTQDQIRTVWARLQTPEDPIIVEVAYLTVSRNGQLRHPVFKGVRQDLSPTDCDIGQIRDVGRP